MVRNKITFAGIVYYWDGRYFISARGKRLHVAVWESCYGPVPQGCCVHHRDNDRRNNAIDNLEILTRSGHAKLHMADPERREMSRRTVTTAIEAAREWHGSEQGLEWHRKHYEQTKHALHAKRYRHICRRCGKEFWNARKNKSDCCSRACRQAMRRRDGIDGVSTICPQCGREFLRNKYFTWQIRCSRECYQAYRRGEPPARSASGLLSNC